MMTTPTINVPSSMSHGARFDTPTIWMHWLTLALICILFGTAWLSGPEANFAQAAVLLLVHRSAGVLIWGLTVMRLVWRWSKGHRPALPHDMGALQRFAARANEVALYALLVLQPLTGLAQSLFPGKAFALFFGMVPALVARDRSLTHFTRDVHEYGAWALLALIGVHALAALFHHFVVRDHVLKAMLPWRAR